MLRTPQAPSTALHRAAAAARVDLVHRLGRGGQGQVWCVRRRADGRLQALKVLPRHSQRQRARFAREAEAAAAALGPHLVGARGSLEGRGWGALVLPHVPGVSLALLVALHRSTPPDAVLATVALGVLEALDELHARGWQHRDVAPHNVVVTPSGDVRLIDFGAAVRLGARGPAVGRAEFMAPEQKAGAPASAAADVFSVGRMLLALKPSNLALVSLAKSLAQPEPMLRPSLRDAANTLREHAAEPAELGSLVGPWVPTLTPRRAAGVPSRPRAPEHRAALRPRWSWAVAAGLCVASSVSQWV